MVNFRELLCNVFH